MRHPSWTLTAITAPIGRFTGREPCGGMAHSEEGPTTGRAPIGSAAIPESGIAGGRTGAIGIALRLSG
jgi:hypothetical protein